MQSEKVILRLRPFRLSLQRDHHLHVLDLPIQRRAVGSDESKNRRDDQDKPEQAGELVDVVGRDGKRGLHGWTKKLIPLFNLMRSRCTDSVHRYAEPNTKDVTQRSTRDIGQCRKVIALQPLGRWHSACVGVLRSKRVHGPDFRVAVSGIGEK
ncbi:hypothetical protein D3C85_1014590 [compost metagenome]